MFHKIKMWILDDLSEMTKGDYFFLLFLVLFFIICNIPLNYYITIGGGISDAANRIQVEDGYSHEGLFNISYVRQLDANVLTYGLSFLIPSWEREDANLYKYSDSESLKDIQYRSDLDLKTSNGTATYWAYTTASKKVKLESQKIYVISIFSENHDYPLKIGDEIVSVDGKQMNTLLEIKEYIASREIGDLLNVHVIRNDKEMDFKVPVYSKEGVNLMGVRLQYVKKYKTDPKLSIQFKRSESGPSGGLITALEIYNQLTRDDLTKGKVIAGTGTIEEDGSIGEIGGIEHKILGAVGAHAEIFLCPGGDNYKEAKDYIKKKKLKIQLIQVDTFSDAIKKLEELS